MTALKLTQIGNSLGLILPKEILLLLKVKKGDTLYLTEIADGMRLTALAPEFEEQMKTAREIMEARKAALHKLAK